MSQPKVVLFSYSGRTLPALVLASRSGETSHLGKDGEPILTVAFIDPARETGLGKDKDGNFVYPIGRIPNVFIEHDVVHASHEFADEFLAKHNLTKDSATPAEIAAHRGHGEWKAVELLEIAPEPEVSEEPAASDDPIDPSDTGDASTDSDPQD